MPNLDQAKKALRQSERRKTQNDRWRKKLRAGYKALRLAITAGDKEAAQKNYIELSSTLDRAARQHIIHPNKASRKKSRLSKAVSKIGA